MLQSILFHNEDPCIVLMDGPKSIEDAQFLNPVGACQSGKTRRLISSKPPEKPFKTPEPKQPTLNPSLGAALAELTAAAAIENALKVLYDLYSGPWCLSRVHAPQEEDMKENNRDKKRKAEEADAPEKVFSDPVIPEESVYLHGTVSSERPRFLKEAPKFDLIVMDPPWPNRSVRRKRGSYHTANDLGEIRETLSLIPIASHLTPEGLVAVWITNKASVLELLTSPRGLFAEWGLELVCEWTWLKVTTAGEPIVSVDSTWRKPWERLLIAKRQGAGMTKLPGQGRVIVSVPDLHSRKPNLRPLFEDILPPGYRALEVFARNLTAGWWSWGDEVLKFQQPEHWVEP
jgi:N6-adenosine-specific RNA methylase IME4